MKASARASLAALATVCLAGCGTDVTSPVSPTGRTHCPDPNPVDVSVVPVQVFVQAHQDDWQLFVGDLAYQQLAARQRVVFVYTTAGDAGSSPRYWKSREAGTISSLASVLGPAALACEARVIRGHSMQRCAYANTVSYFLRLPDGNIDTGLGYPARGNESLTQLRSKGKPVNAVDSTTTYTTWSDFTNTLGEVIDQEVPAGEGALVYTTDIDTKSSSVDHPDHIATGQATEEALASRQWCRRQYLGYALTDRQDNLPDSAVQVKRDLMRAYDDRMIANGYLAATTGRALLWLHRTYTRLTC